MSLTIEAQSHIEVLELPQDHPFVEMLEPTMEFSHLPEEAASELSTEHCEPQEAIELPEHLELVVEELPGVEGLDPDLEKALEVSEDTSKDKEEKEDANDARKAKKISKWNWEEKGASGFVAWIKERLVDVPKHSGYDKAGLERAIAYMEKLDDEISRAMRNDLDGELDADKIEDVRAKIEDGIERLHSRIEKVKKKSGAGKKRKKAEEEMDLIKVAGKSPTITGIVITVPLLISRIARVCLNGMISAGHDIEVIYKEQVEKYKLTTREQAELMQHLADMGMPLAQDRYYLPNEEVDITNGKGDWSSQYQA